MKRIGLLLIFLCFVAACNKKEDQVVKEPTNSSQTLINACPTCNLPDTVWKESGTGPKLIFKIKLDSTLQRLSNSGAIAPLTQGNGAQSPRFNSISVNYIEMVLDDFTKLGEGTVLYKAEETDCRGSRAIVFCKEVLCKNGDSFFSIPLKDVRVGTYKWLRTSVAYQNYDVKIKTTSGGLMDGTVASFVGFNTYVDKFKMKNTVMTPTLNSGSNKMQGYWGFYTNIFGVDIRTEGQSVKTTVVNPNPNSPIPLGSSVFTGEFYRTSASGVQPLTITGNEVQDIIVTVSLSTNKSFEWKELTFDGLFQPEIGESVVDMGLRGMIPSY